MGKRPRKSKRPAKHSQQTRREPAERMLQIHEMLKAGKYPSCEELAAKLGVSSRGVRRDISYMRDHLSLPIDYDFARQGYHYTSHVAHFPGSERVNPHDVLGLMVAQKTLAQYEDAPFAALLKEARDRLMQQLSPEGRITVEGLDHALAFRAVGVDTIPTRAMESVLNALLEKRVLEFQYRKPGERIIESRSLHAYHVFYAKARWYVVGHDPLRKMVRTFAISRMQDVALSFKKAKGADRFNFQEYFKKSFGVMSGQDDWEVVVDFDAWSTDIMRGRQWHPTQQITELPNGSSRVRFVVGNVEEVLEWVLEWGMHAHVVRPAALRRRLRDIGECYLSRYAYDIHESDKPSDPDIEPEFPTMSRATPSLDHLERN